MLSGPRTLDFPPPAAFLECCGKSERIGSHYSGDRTPPLAPAIPPIHLEVVFDRQTI